MWKEAGAVLVQRTKPPSGLNGHYPLSPPTRTVSNQLAIHALRSNGFLAINKTLLAHYGLEMAAYLANLADKYEYFQKRGMLTSDGAFFLTHESQTSQIGLPLKTIQRCKARCKEQGILSTYMKGVPAKEYYLVRFQDIWSFLEEPKVDGALPERVELALAKRVEHDLPVRAGLINETRIKDTKDKISPKSNPTEKHKQLALSLEKACLHRKKPSSDTTKWPKQIASVCQELKRKGLEEKPETWLHQVIKYLDRMYSLYGMDSEHNWIPTVESPGALLHKRDQLINAMHRTKPNGAGKIAGRRVKHRNGSRAVLEGGEPIYLDSWDPVLDKHPETGEKFEEGRIWASADRQRFVFCPTYPEPRKGEMHEKAIPINPEQMGLMEAIQENL